MRPNSVVKSNVFSRLTPSITISEPNPTYANPPRSFGSDLFLRYTGDDSLQSIDNYPGTTKSFTNVDSFFSSIISRLETYQSSRLVGPQFSYYHPTYANMSLYHRFHPHVFNIAQLPSFSCDTGILHRERYNIMSTKPSDGFPLLTLQYIDVTHADELPSWVKPRIQPGRVHVIANQHQVYAHDQLSTAMHSVKSSVLSQRINYISAMCPITLTPSSLQTTIPNPSSKRDQYGEDDGSLSQETLLDDILSSRECVAVGGRHSLCLLPYSPSSITKAAGGANSSTPIYFRCSDLSSSSQFLRYSSQPDAYQGYPILNSHSKGRHGGEADHAQTLSPSHPVPPPVYLFTPGYTSWLATPIESSPPPASSSSSHTMPTPQPITSRMYSSHHTGHIYMHDFCNHSSTLVHKLEHPATQFVCGKDQFATCLATASQGVHLIDYRSKQPALMLLGDQDWKRASGTFLSAHPRVMLEVTTDHHRVQDMVGSRFPPHPHSLVGDGGSSGGSLHSTAGHDRRDNRPSQHHHQQDQSHHDDFSLLPWRHRRLRYSQYGRQRGRGGHQGGGSLESTGQPQRSGHGIAISASPSGGSGGADTQLSPHYQGSTEDSITITTIKARMHLSDYQLPSTKYTVQWNPYRDYQIASGGVDGVSMYDIRMGKELYRYRVCDHVYANRLIHHDLPLSSSSSGTSQHSPSQGLHEQERRDSTNASQIPHPKQPSPAATSLYNSYDLVPHTRSSTPVTNLHYVNNGQHLVAVTLHGDVLAFNTLSTSDEMHARVVLHGGELASTMLANRVQLDGTADDYDDDDDTDRGHPTSTKLTDNRNVQQRGKRSPAAQRASDRDNTTSSPIFGIPHTNPTNYTDTVLPVCLGSRIATSSPPSFRIPLFRSTLYHNYLILPHHNNVNVLSLHSVNETLMIPNDQRGSGYVDETTTTMQPLVVTLVGSSSPILSVLASSSSVRDNYDLVQHISTLFNKSQGQKQKVAGHEAATSFDPPTSPSSYTSNEPHTSTKLCDIPTSSPSAALPTVMAGCVDGSILTWSGP